MNVNTKPAGPVPVWATNVTMTDIAPFGGNPTKIKPAPGIIAEGYHVNEQPSSQRLNWKENDQDRRLAVVDMIEARSFVEPGDGGGICNPGTGGAVGDFCAVPWTVFPQILRASASYIVSASVDGGYTWTTDLNAGAGACTGIAARDDGSNQGCVAVALTNGATPQIYMRGAVGAWISTALNVAPSGSGATTCITADAFDGNGMWIGGSTTATPTPTIWKVVDNHGIFSSQTQLTCSPSGAIGAGCVVRLIAAGPTYKIGAMYVGATNYLWRWQDGDATAVAVTPPTADEIRDLLWCPEDKVFLLIASSVGHVVTFWQSPDGSTGSWAQIAPDSTGAAFLNADAYVRGACVRGSILMVPISYNSGAANIVMVSGSLGATWKQVADPLRRHQSQAPVPVTTVCRNLGEQFMAAGYVAASKSAHALTLRAG